MSIDQVYYVKNDWFYSVYMLFVLKVIILCLENKHMNKEMENISLICHKVSCGYSEPQPITQEFLGH